MKINYRTKLYGVIGNPVAHSHSPRIFNTLFAKRKINAVYHFWEVLDNTPNNLKLFCKNIKNLNIGGLSITIPFKKKILPYLDELNPLAEKLACVNTVIIKKGKMIGYNFDGIAAIQPLTKIKNWKGKKILCLGIGGAAQGIILTLYHYFQYPKPITIAARNLTKYKSFSKTLYASTGNVCSFLNWEKLSSKEIHHFDLIINTTPIGMDRGIKKEKPYGYHYPTANKSPLNSQFIHPHQIIYDIIYNPIKTKLLKEASKKKATTINGLKMFLEQAKLQFELWTNQKISFQQMEKIYEQ